MSKISAINITVDSAPGVYGFADELALPDDSWGGSRPRAYKPYVFGYTDIGVPPVLRLSGGWFASDADSGGEVYLILRDRNYTVIGDPILLYSGMVVISEAYTAEIYSVSRAGHLRILHGTGPCPFVANMGNNMHPRGIQINYTNIATWTAYQGPDGDPSHGVIRLSPVECGVGGNISNVRVMDTTTTITANFEFIYYGVATLKQDQDLVGTVTGGIYVSDFTTLFTPITGGAVSSGGYNMTPEPWNFWAVYYKLTAAGVTAGALPPDRKFNCTNSRPYIRSQTPYSVA